MTTFKKVHTKSSEISKECKTWFNKISNCLSFQGKKGMEEICILKLNPENIGHLTLQYIKLSPDTIVPDFALTTTAYNYMEWIS